MPIPFDRKKTTEKPEYGRAKRFVTSGMGFGRQFWADLDGTERRFLSLSGA
jgi:hypothetical protein